MAPLREQQLSKTARRLQSSSDSQKERRRGQRKASPHRPNPGRKLSPCLGCQPLERHPQDAGLGAHSARHGRTDGQDRLGPGKSLASLITEMLVPTTPDTTVTQEGSCSDGHAHRREAGPVCNLEILLSGICPKMKTVSGGGSRAVSEGQGQALRATLPSI